MANELPVLWHIAVSPYSEKARWALAHKGVEHDRRATPPGPHMAVALWVTRGGQYTFPVLRLDGEAIGGSSAIIGALEARYPEPPLYPDGPVQRRRALDLEAFFDAGIGPAVRLYAWHHVLHATDGMAALAVPALPGRLREFAPARAAITRFGKAFINLRFRVASPEAEAGARERILAGVDRLEAELGGGEHLAGQAFSVADLTAAALLYPLVRPPGGPGLPQPPASMQPFLASLRERPAWGWVERTFAAHRRPSPAG